MSDVKSKTFKYPVANSPIPHMYCLSLDYWRKPGASPWEHKENMQTQQKESLDLILEPSPEVTVLTTAKNKMICLYL